MMSIDNATPRDWDRTNNKSSKPYVDPYDMPTPDDYLDEVNNPSHYNAGEIECIDAIKASMTPEAFKGYCKGNTLKYIWRMSYKGKPVEDLRKASWYLDRLIRAEVDNPSAR
jgi:hypothetical protein